MQANSCSICGRNVKVEVDHDHESGHVRGSLCRRCNSGLAMFLDDPNMLHKALVYLENPNGTDHTD